MNGRALLLMAGMLAVAHSLHGLLGLGAEPGAGAADRGRAALAAGRTGNAVSQLEEAVSAAGAGAPSGWWHDLALARLAAGDATGAEIAAEHSAARGGAALEGFRDMVHGHAAWLRAERAAAVAAGPEAEPFAWELALEQARRAREAWQRAATRHIDWPAARRNVERVLLREEDWREARRRAAASTRTLPDRPRVQPGAARVPPEGDPPAGPEERSSPRAVELEAMEERLSADDVAALADRLRALHEEKRTRRKQGAEARRVPVERDW